jgi:hypothetical protein
VDEHSRVVIQIKSKYTSTKYEKGLFSAIVWFNINLLKLSARIWVELTRAPTLNFSAARPDGGIAWKQGCAREYARNGVRCEQNHNKPEW